MKKYILTAAAVIVALLSVFAFGCKKSDAEIVGTYYLITVTADNGIEQKVYNANGTNPVVTKTSFVLEIKSNYRWKMNITLPGITETEDGKWSDRDGVYTLKEDKDDPSIVLNYNDGTVTFYMAEDGYVLAVTLAKNIL